MKLRLLTAVAFLTVAMVAPSRSAAQAPATPRDGIVVHITHGAEDPHRLLMGLQMAAGMTDTHVWLAECD